MALTVTVGDHLDEGAGTGARSRTVNIGPGPFDAIVVVDCLEAGGSTALITNVAYDGNAMAISQTSPAVLGYRVRVWTLSAGFGAYAGGSVQLTFTDNSNAFNCIRVYGISGAGKIKTPVVGFGNSGVAGVQMDFGSQSSVLDGAIIGGKSGFSAAGISGFTNDTTHFIGSVHSNHGHETTPKTGARTLGWQSQGSSSWTNAGVMIEQEDITFSPDLFGVELGFLAPTFAVGGDTTLLPHKLGVKLGFLPATFEAVGPRQVALVGNDLDTSEMTEGGTEGQRLTYHEKRKPTWEDDAGGGGGGGADGAGRWVPMTIRLDPDGSPDAWELRFTDGGDVRMMRVVDDDALAAIGTPSNGLGYMGLGLDGLGD